MDAAMKCKTLEYSFRLKRENLRMKVGSIFVPES
jgi:hypothetical protein